MKHFDDYDIVLEQVNKYLDIMPNRSSVTYPDLVHSIRDMLEFYTPPAMKVSDNQIYSVAVSAVEARTDLVIMKGLVIYKLK